MKIMIVTVMMIMEIMKIVIVTMIMMIMEIMKIMIVTMIMMPTMRMLLMLVVKVIGLATIFWLDKSWSIIGGHQPGWRSCTIMYG